MSTPGTALRPQSPARFTNILRNQLIPGTKLIPSRIRSHRTSPLRPVSASWCQRAKEIKQYPPFAQRVDFERSRKGAEPPFKLGISGPVGVPNLDTVFEAGSQRTVRFKGVS